MKKFKKALVLFLCAVLLVAGSVAGTLAYLQAKSDVVQNTFTIGDVQIDLDEANVDEYGDLADLSRVKSNEYKLLPGHDYIKDPTVTVKADSEESYIRMFVTINKQAQLDAIFTVINEERANNNLDPLTIANVLTGADNNKWIPFAEVENNNNTRTYEFRYYKTVSTVDAGDMRLEPLFTKIEMPGEITNAQLKTLYAANATDNLKIDVVAEAIQADGFDTADAAWAEWNAAQNS